MHQICIKYEIKRRMDSFVVYLKLLSFLLIVFSNYLFEYFDSESTHCSNGYFRIGRMKSCHQLLDCSDYMDMTRVVLFSRGLVKKVYLYKWNDNYIVVSKLSDQKYAEDFVHNINVLKQLSPNPFTVQLIGWCNNDMVFTEYHPFGDATQLLSILDQQMSQYNNVKIKFNFCINYVKIIDYLHNSPIGTLVMCDSNSLEKTLSQYLVTNDLKLVLNDLDALPQVSGHRGVKCGSRQLFGSFVAPEQLWHSSSQPFDDQLMREYDHKTDIWKIPDVCHWFLNLSRNQEFESSLQLIENNLIDIHNRCKSIDPQKRPTTQQILQVYQQIHL